MDIAERIYKALEGQAEDPRRPHLGCSLIGHPCRRWLWISFRWAVVEKHSGRMLRLFRRGHEEEDKVVADLRRAGINIKYAGANQQRVHLSSHVSGSMDGVIAKDGIEERKGEGLFECKTANKKSFDKIQKEGVKKAKYQHYVQMNLYMGARSLRWALYIVVCKDDDRIYSEIVDYDPSTDESNRQKAAEVVASEGLPAPVSHDPSWWECKFCASYNFCHRGKNCTEINCRTCAHSTPVASDEWECSLHGGHPPVDFQRIGCHAHVFHPELVPEWKLLRGEDEGKTAVFDIEGKEVKNGSPDLGGVTSREILSGYHGGDDKVDAFRSMFGGEVVEVKEEERV